MSFTLSTGNVVVANSSAAIVSQTDTTATIRVTINAYITDGLMYPSSSWAGAGSGEKCVLIDLGDIYNLDEVAVWHYYEDSRTYKNSVTYVSSNNSNWTVAIKK